MKWIVTAVLGIAAGGVMAGNYEPTWESLAQHEPAPEWLKDAKLGIYFHWGPYSVPAFGNEWYPRNMYLDDTREYKHHAKTYGDQAKFGYHDFVPMFTAEHFDPDEWAELFRKAGARFAGPVAEHHDGFSMWDSEITPWNAKDKGPKRDILGELFEALRKRDMKTIATFHHARNLQRNTKDGYGKSSSSHYPYHPDWATSSEDEALRLLYGNVPEEEWHEKIWLGKLIEVIDTYQPDMIWFDSWLDRIPESYRQRFCAYYLNAAASRGRDVAIIRKQQDLPLDFTINDHEKAREAKALPELWMTDDTISTGSWCFTQDLRIKPLYKVVHALIDTVAKNGVVLLNVSPKADGTIPQDQRDVLLGLGAWLEANGEAVYGTRPWTVAAEGPTSEPTGGFHDRRAFLNLEYSAKDIRYTASKDGKTVYAILMGTPGNGTRITMKAFQQADVKARRVELLSGGRVRFENTGKGLKAVMPEPADRDAPATVLRISL
jgi:alpha-L-fucosidase